MIRFACSKRKCKRSASHRIVFHQKTHVTANNQHRKRPNDQSQCNPCRPGFLKKLSWHNKASRTYNCAQRNGPNAFRRNNFLEAGPILATIVLHNLIRCRLKIAIQSQIPEKAQYLDTSIYSADPAVPGHPDRSRCLFPPFRARRHDNLLH